MSALNSPTLVEQRKSVAPLIENIQQSDDPIELLCNFAVQLKDFLDPLAQLIQAAGRLQKLHEMLGEGEGSDALSDLISVDMLAALANRSGGLGEISLAMETKLSDLVRAAEAEAAQ